MLGFIKKDLLMTKSNLKSFLIIFIIYLFLAIEGEFDISSLPSLICTMLMISTFNYDSYNHFEAYGVTLPKGRKNIVLAKYLATIILVVITTFLTFIALGLISYFKTNMIDYSNLFFKFLIVIAETFLVIAIMYPIIFKLGVEKARIGIFIIIFGIVILGGILVKYLDSSFITTFLSKYSMTIFPILVIILSVLSYLISLKVYLKKEF